MYLEERFNSEKRNQLNMNIDTNTPDRQNGVYSLSAGEWHYILSILHTYYIHIT